MLSNNQMSTVMCLFLFCLLGCGGGSNNSTGENKAPSVQSGAGTGSPATSDSGSSSAAAAQVVMCGSATCSVPPEANGLVKACCAEEATNMCGLTSSFVKNECKPPAPPHPICPSLTIAGATAAGCCTAMGKCGIDVSIIGMGCIDSSRAGGMTMIGGMMIEAPPPLECSADGAAATGDDAGVADAG
jgi:hypothetical protein